MVTSRARLLRSRPISAVAAVAALVGVARYATSRDTPTYGNPPGSPVRGGGVPSRGIVRMVTGAIEGVAPPRRDRHVLTRAEAIDPLRSTEDRVTWLGHAGFAIRLAGIDVLVDPFLDDFASPVWGIGPRRLDPSPFRASDMLHPHVVLLSHNHYDHLDRRTLFALPGRTAAWAVVPEGLGPYVRQIGFAHVTELPWGASVDVGPVTVTSIPAVHFSGRGLFDRNRTHWNGYLIASKRRRVYFAGDTAYSPTLGRLRPSVAHATSPLCQSVRTCRRRSCPLCIQLPKRRSRSVVTRAPRGSSECIGEPSRCRRNRPLNPHCGSRPKRCGLATAGTKS